MLFCIRPLNCSTKYDSSTQLKADAVIIDGATKRFCTECFDKHQEKKENERVMFDGISKQKRYRAMEQVEMEP